MRPLGRVSIPDLAPTAHTKYYSRKPTRTLPAYALYADRGTIPHQSLIQGEGSEASVRAGEEEAKVLLYKVCICGSISAASHVLQNYCRTGLCDTRLASKTTEREARANKPPRRSFVQREKEEIFRHRKRCCQRRSYCTIRFEKPPELRQFAAFWSDNSLRFSPIL